DIIAEFYSSSQWKELSKETSNPQTEVHGISIRFAPTGRYHIVPYGKLNGIPVALVARFGVIFKGTDRIRVSYGG
ncbi:hypothetical protein Tco_1208261, partial [Tanacetum coccineum]